MQFIDAAEVARRTPYPALMNAIATGVRQNIESPLRSHFNPNHDASSVLVMAAWKPGEVMGVKMVSIWPGNAARQLPSVSATYVLSSCVDGRPLAVIDGTELTLRRTAAACALGAQKLARANSRRLAVLGTGALCSPLVQAHAAVFELDDIVIWGRNRARAQGVVDALAQQGIQARAGTDLQAVLAESDMVAAATTATTPFIEDTWVQPGTHLGLVGAFTPDMAEAQPALMARATVYADTRAGVLQKGGEVLQAIRQGLMREDQVLGELADLVNPDATTAGRTNGHEVTVFKTVGFAALDLIAAELVYF